MSAPDPLRQSAAAALDLAARQLRNLVTNHPDHFPLYTEGGKWLHGGAAWTNWCEGFLPGQLWLIHQQTGDPMVPRARYPLLPPHRTPRDRHQRP